VVQCEHCHSPIIDPTTQVVHGGLTYCCANCSAAVEQYGPGSDPDSATGKNHLMCAHCNAPIVYEAHMESRGDQAFCCRNCAQAAAGAAQEPMAQEAKR
jgi:DNA-directed RNA polymerase subunit RPC12/RpoP